MEKSCMLIQFSRWPKKMLRKHFCWREQTNFKKMCTIYYQVLKMERKFVVFSMVLLNNKNVYLC